MGSVRSSSASGREGESFRQRKWKIYYQHKKVFRSVIIIRCVVWQLAPYSSLWFKVLLVKVDCERYLETC